MSTDNPTPHTHHTIADLAWVDVTYETADRFGIHQDSDPNYKYVQHISGRIEGKFEDDFDKPVHLGTLYLARIDLGETTWHNLLTALDAQSAEWTHYHDVIDEDDWHDGLLIIDRIELDSWARGHNIGLHVLARAIRTWGGTDDLVVCIAYPLGKEGQEGDAGAAKLARHWAKLGLEHVKGTHPPILTGDTSSAAFHDQVWELCGSLPGGDR